MLSPPIYPRLLYSWRRKAPHLRRPTTIQCTCGRWLADPYSIMLCGPATSRNRNCSCNFGTGEFWHNEDTLNIDKDIIELLRIRRLTYFLSRVSYGSWKISTHCTKGSRTRGSPRKKWLDNVREDCAAVNLTLVEAMHSSCWRQTFLGDIQMTLGLPARDDSVIVADSLSQVRMLTANSIDVRTRDVVLKRSGGRLKQNLDKDFKTI